MNQRTKGNVESVRMLDMQQGATYYGMGRNSFRKFAEEIGALRRFGRTLRADRKVIDDYFDALPAYTGENNAD